jgi:spoIIIJ-associated protein
MPRKLIEQKLSEIMSHMGISPEIVIEDQEGTHIITINGDDLSFLIGYRGQSLNALQTLLANMLFNETGEWHHLVIDINGYRDSRKESLQEMVRNFIDRVRFHNEDVEMPPMNAFERRQVHMFISEYPDIESESTGSGYDRRVVLRVK